MNLKNLLALTIRTLDFNIVAQQPELLKKLRKLTEMPTSGLNHELNRMLSDAEQREVDCKILLAYRFKILVGWAILSKENSNFFFPRSSSGFNSANGYLFQVYTDPNYRRQGIASSLFKMAKQHTKNDIVNVCPWDDRSESFFNKLQDLTTRWL